VSKTILITGVNSGLGRAFAKGPWPSATASLAQEVAHIGIHVTALTLGAFRTDWAGRSMTRVPRTIPDHDTVFDPIRAARRPRTATRRASPPAPPRPCSPCSPRTNPRSTWSLEPTP